MAWRFSPYAVPLFASAVLLLGIIVLAWRERAAKGARLLAILSVTTVLYVGGYAFELSGTTLEWVKFWIRFEYIGIACVPFVLLALILVYTGHEKYLTPLNVAMMSVIPAITIVLAWTSNYHDWMWRDMHLQAYGRQWLIAFSTGPWYWVNVSAVWVIVVVGLVVLFPVFMREQGIYRAQSRLMLVALACPMAAYAIYLSKVIPIPVDVTAYALALTAIVMAWMVLNTQFLDLMPVARQVVLDNLPDAVIVVDARSRVIHLNPTARTLIGPGAAAQLGKPFPLVFPDQLVSVMAGNPGKKSQEIAFFQQGEVRCWEARLSPLLNRYGNSDGSLIVLRDVSERKHADEERERLITNLDAFAHTVAHDLKNLVTVLLTYSVSLQEDLTTMTTSDILGYLAVMVESGQKLNNVIDALLLLARVDKMASIPIAPLNMGAIVAQARKRLTVLIAQAGADICEPETWPVTLGYAPWIEEVWVNYLSNAIKYGGTPPLITVSAVVLPDGKVQFSVQDGGPGFTAEQQRQLFMPFQQLHQLHTNGHGLGLSIVMSIVQRLGGEVSAQSVPGRGSTFSFTLPGPPAS